MRRKRRKIFHWHSFDPKSPKSYDGPIRDADTGIPVGSSGMYLDPQQVPTTLMKSSMEADQPVDIHSKESTMQEELCGARYRGTPAPVFCMLPESHNEADPESEEVWHEAVCTKMEQVNYVAATHTLSCTETIRWEPDEITSNRLARSTTRSYTKKDGND